MKPKKRKKKQKSVISHNILDQFPEPPTHLLDNYYELELTDDFLSQILKYVDDLCNFINNGDQNLERSMEVNQNLNNAVSCYRVKLLERRQVVSDTKIEGEAKRVHYPCNWLLGKFSSIRKTLSCCSRREK